MKCASLVLFALFAALPASGKKHHHHHNKHHRHHHEKHLRAHKETALDDVNLLSVSQQSEQSDAKTSKETSQAPKKETQPSANEIEQLVDIKPDDIDAQIAQLTMEDSQIATASLPTLTDEQIVPKAQIATASLPTLTDEQIVPKAENAPKDDLQIDPLSQLVQEREPKIEDAQEREPTIEDQLQQVASVESETEASFQKAFGSEDASLQALAHAAPSPPAHAAPSPPAQSDEQLVSLGNLDSLVDAAAVEGTPSVEDAEKELKAAAANALRSKNEVHPKTQVAPKARVTEEKSQHVANIDQQDAKEIDGYIKQSSQEQLREKLKSMAKQGGTARIHGAVRALMKMGYTAKAVSEWVAGRDPEAGMSINVREKGATPALDAKLMYMALKRSEQSELRKVVNTMFRYGGAARVQRAQAILSMWLRREQAPQPETKQSSPVEHEVFSELASVKQQLALSDATELAGHLENNDLPGLRAFISKIRSDGGEQRVVAASNEVKRQVQNAAASHATDAQSSGQPSGDTPWQRIVAAQNLKKAQDASKAQQSAKVTLAQAVGKTEKPPPAAEKAKAPPTQVPVQAPAKSPAPDDRKGRGRSQPKKVDLVAQAREEEQQVQVDAAILVKYLKKHDNKGLKLAYNEMRKHGGWQRVDKAETLAKSMM